MGQPRPFFVYFWSFQTNYTLFTANQCEKMSKCPSSVWQCMDSNPQPYKHESSPITTRPGLPPKKFTVGQTERAIFCKIDTLPNTLSSQVKWVWIIESDFWKVIFASNVVSSFSKRLQFLKHFLRQILRMWMTAQSNLGENYEKIWKILLKFYASSFL